MEYGEPDRRPHSNAYATEDVDTAPIWRMLAAWIWNADCLQRHTAEVAADAILTTHLIAVACAAGLPRDDMMAMLALNQAGAGNVINALSEDGLAAGRAHVDTMDIDTRRTIISECNAVILKGYTALHLDLGARFPR
jgi:hypothetical protein